MQDLASEFSKNYVDPLPHPTPSPGLCWDPNIGPLNFSAVVAPLLFTLSLSTMMVVAEHRWQDDVV